jgi:hypothetical protein
MTGECVTALERAGLVALPQLVDALARGGAPRSAAEGLLSTHLGAAAKEAIKVGYCRDCG